MELVEEQRKVLGPIGRNIKFIRELRGLTQTGIGEELGISQQTISSIERSENMDMDRISEFSKILGVSTDFLVNCGDLVEVFLKGGAEPIAKRSPRREVKPRELKKIEELYERLLQAERDKVDYLEKLLDRNALRELPRSYAVLNMA